ncbi:MAG: InlB B-repeat-containing protein [Treponema sp.]|nr:InlB B-repeat-containing protein [Candidatus Treponema equi]
MRKILYFTFVFSFFIPLFSACNFDTIERNLDYRVLHYLQNIEDDEYTLYETEELTANSDDTINIVPKSYAGFSALPTENQKISAGTDIVIKYNRNTITCTLNFNGGKVVLQDGTEKTYDVISGRYGAKIPMPNPQKKGYLLEEWVDSNGNVLGETFVSSGTYTASYVAKSTSSYTVHHLYQNIEDDEYTEALSEKEILEGMAGTKTAVAGKTVEGFFAKEIEQKTILADESTELYVYYNRNLVTFSFNLAGGEGTASVTRKYGTTVTSLVVNNPVKGNSTFSGWNPKLPDSFIEDGTFTAVWDMPCYTVEYKFESIDGSGYSIDPNYPAEKFYGEKGTLTEASAKTIPGFIANEIKQETITEDNNTLVTIEYKRKTITLYIDLKGGVGTRYIQGKYGEGNEAVKTKLSKLKKPVRAGFSLDENDVYSVSEDLDFSLQNDETTQIFVKWIGGAAAKYCVVVMTENADFTSAEERYVKYETLLLDGLAGDMTQFTENKDERSISIEGRTYSFPHFVPEGNENVEIAGDDSAVLYIYFNREIINLTYDLNGGNINGNGTPVVISGRYDSTVNKNDIPKDVVRDGCVSYTWDDSFEKFPETDRTIKAQWEGNPCKVTFHLGDQTEEKIYKYAAEYAVPSLSDFTTLTASDSGVSGWKMDKDSSQIDFVCGHNFTLPEPKDYDLYACEETHFYTVKYLLQNKDDDGYTEQSKTDRIYAAPGSETSVTPKDMIGFHSMDYEKKKVADDNSTVVEIKYDRNLYTLKFVLGDGGYAEINEKDGNNNYKKLYSLPDVQVKYEASYETGEYRLLRAGYYAEKMRWVYENGESASGDFNACYSNYSNGNLAFTIKPVVEDTTVYLSGEICEFVVTLKNSNGLLEKTRYDKFKVSDAVVDLKDLNYNGYTFEGWYYDNKFIEFVDAKTINGVLKPVIDSIKDSKVTLYAKWTNDSVVISNEIKSVGDIILVNGQVVNIPSSGEKPIWDGFVPKLTDDQKNDAIGVATHKVDGIWRFIGKSYNESASMGELGVKSSSVREDKYSVTNSEKEDGYKIFTKYNNSGYKTQIENNSPAWKYAFNYGNSLSSFKTEWYIPAEEEMVKFEENYDNIAMYIGIIKGKAISDKSEVWLCNYTVVKETGMGKKSTAGKYVMGGDGACQPYGDGNFNKVIVFHKFN